MERLGARVDALAEGVGVAVQHALERLVEEVVHARAHLLEEAARVTQHLKGEEHLVELREHLLLVARADALREDGGRREVVLELERLELERHPVDVRDQGADRVEQPDGSGGRALGERLQPDAAGDGAARDEDAKRLDAEVAQVDLVGTPWAVGIVERDVEEREQRGEQARADGLQVAREVVEEEEQSAHEESVDHQVHRLHAHRDGLVEAKPWRRKVDADAQVDGGRLVRHAVAGDGLLLLVGPKGAK